MTTTEKQSQNPTIPDINSKERNAAIAEACPGLFKEIGKSGWHYKVVQFGQETWVRCIGGSICDDLNAMHEAEKGLDHEQKTDLCANGYQENLHDVCVRGLQGITIGDAWYLQIHATARERAESFLKTIGKE